MSSLKMVFDLVGDTYTENLEFVICLFMFLLHTVVLNKLEITVYK